MKKNLLTDLHTRGKKRVTLSELERVFIRKLLEKYDCKKETLPSFVQFYAKLLSKFYEVEK